jgi:hypothetical protein
LVGSTSCVEISGPPITATPARSSTPASRRPASRGRC